MNFTYFSKILLFLYLDYYKKMNIFQAPDFLSSYETKGTAAKIFAYSSFLIFQRSKNEFYVISA